MLGLRRLLPVLAICLSLQSLEGQQRNTNFDLLAAAKAGSEATVRSLLEGGASREFPRPPGRHATQHRGAPGSSSAWRRSLWSTAPTSISPIVAKVTPLMSASFSGNVDIVRLLLDHKADVALTDRVHKTAMVYAAGSGRADCVQALLDAGVDVNARFWNDETALMWAAGEGEASTVKLLLARGADVTAKDNRGMTAGMIAAEQHQAEVVEVLRAAK